MMSWYRQVPESSPEYLPPPPPPPPQLAPTPDPSFNGNLLETVLKKRVIVWTVIGGILLLIAVGVYLPLLFASSVRRLTVGIVIGGFILLVTVGIFVIWYIRRNRRRPDEGPATSHPMGFSKIIFSYEELAMATNGFSKNNFLGQGGFGPVHKGVLPNKKVVAVKQLKLDSKQGDPEFRTEVKFISRVHHRHLVSLVGYCISREQRLLVYEFVPNGNLEYHLHGLESPTMNWPTRLKIAIGSAKGLAYLHEDCQPKIIHRDIKAANILLDSNFDAKVSDFGLAKFLLDTMTHITTRVMGTFGYLAPEYASSGQLTDKSDVFSFGVVLLELITGLKPLDKTQSFPNDSLVEWARPLLAQALKHGNFDAVVDPRLQNDYEPTELARMVACAAACVRYMARSRPRISQHITLLPFLHGKQIVRALEGNLSLDDLNEEISLGTAGNIDYDNDQHKEDLVLEGNLSLDDLNEEISLGTAGNIDYDNDQHKEDLKKFRKKVPISHEQGSSECSGPSTD